MAKLYRRVEVVDGESVEPVHFVGIRVVPWLEGDCNITPTAGFVEIETDIVTDLLEACKASLIWLENAPIDYSNGVVHSGYDEGNVRGWEGHEEITNQLREAITKAEGE